jgi:hypothetical protein
MCAAEDKEVALSEQYSILRSYAVVAATNADEGKYAARSHLSHGCEFVEMCETIPKSDEIPPLFSVRTNLNVPPSIENYGKI